MAKDTNVVSDFSNLGEAQDSLASANKQHSELHRLNLAHAYSKTAFFGGEQSSAPGEKGDFSLRRLKEAVVHRFADFVKRRVLANYLEEESRFTADLVRHLNDLETRLQQKELREEDRILASLHSSEQALRERLGSLELSLEQRYAKLSANQSIHDQQLEQLDSVARGLERIVSGLGKREIARSSIEAITSDKTNETSDCDPSYLLLENRFRGSEEEISKRLQHYADIFSQQSEVVEMGRPVFEIGAGRGELQEVFRGAGICSYGVELDQAMQQRSLQKGLDVRLEDGIKHLELLEDQSLAGIVAVQVIEHLKYDDLKRLFACAGEKIQSGGIIALETINTRSIVALSHNYFRDPTHVAPLHPDTLSFMMEQAGLSVLEVRMLSAFPEQVKFQELAVVPHMTPRWGEAVGLLNHNIRLLNSLLFDHQDYCVIARIT